MANNIMIRTARKDYVCDCCGHKINAGTEYLDKVILNNGKCVRHERYHDECPKINKLLTTLFDNTSPVPVVYDDTKFWLVGMRYGIGGVRQAIIRAWTNTSLMYVDEDIFNKEWRLN